jgi:hypothetical protein
VRLRATVVTRPPDLDLEDPAMSVTLDGTTRPAARTRTTAWGTWGVALLLPLGPLAIAFLRGLLPYYTESDTAGFVAAVRDDPGRQSAVLWLGYVGVLLLVPGLFAAASLCRAAAPRLTAWALALSVPGYLSLGVLMATDHLLWSAQQAGLSTADSVALAESLHPSAGVALGVFILGHVVGTVLLGLALLRSGRVPAWAAWAVAVSQPLHFVATVVLVNPVVDFCAWCLTAVGMAVVGRELVRSAR